MHSKMYFLKRVWVGQLGQFPDLRRGLGEKRGGVFEGVDKPVYTMHFKILAEIFPETWK